MASTLKQRLAQGERLIGAIIMLPSPDVAEVISLSGLQLAMIDHEHGSGCLQDFIAQARAIEGSGMEAMVRIPPGDFRYARRLLDCGARSIVCPGVDTAAQAEAFVKACRYPPRGVRGAGAGMRAARYGLDADYYAPHSEDGLLLVAQIESAEAVANIDAICGVDGIDMLLIGPRDLSASIGKLGRFDDTELLDLIESAERGILASGKLLASTRHQGKTCGEMFAAGYNAILAGKDVDFLLAGASGLAASG